MRPKRRATRQRLEDVVGAIRAIHGHLGRGDLTDPLVFDAVRMRFVEIGEAVGALPDALLASELRRVAANAARSRRLKGATMHA